MEIKMTKILKITALTLLMIGMVFTHPSSVFGQDRSKTPTLSIFPTKVKVSGAVSIQVRPSTTYFHPFFGLVVGSNPARGLEINADGHIIPEYQPGRYRDTIKGYSASPGKRIKVVIKTPKTHTITPYKIPQIKNPILAKTVVGAMARFITPTHNGILNPKWIPPKVNFSWTRCKATYHIYI